MNVNTAGAVGANSGSVRLDQTSQGTIADQAGNGLTGTHNGDQSFSFDTTAPTVTWVVTHNLGTDAVVVGILRLADRVMVTPLTKVPDVNTVWLVNFGGWVANSHQVVVLG